MPSWTRASLSGFARTALANGVIETVHFSAYVPARFETGREYTLNVRRVTMRNLEDEQLVKLSRSGHLFLSLPEMKAIQSYFRQQQREPTDIELETLAQTWSEHCVHKTLKSAVEVVELIPTAERWGGAALWESHQGDAVCRDAAADEGKYRRAVLFVGLRG